MGEFCSIPFRTIGKSSLKPFVFVSKLGYTSSLPKPSLSKKESIM
jgi:hypothetical protein